MKRIDRRATIKKAKEKAKALKKLRADERYELVIGRLVHEKLLDARSIRGHRRKFSIEDALWVGTNIEPRVLELLPAIILKKPGMILFEKLPNDLNEVIISLRKGKENEKFRGIGVKSYSQWLPEVGRKGIYPKASKTFRFSREDQLLLRELSKEMGVSETEVIRQALRKLLTQNRNSQ